MNKDHIQSEFDKLFSELKKIVITWNLLLGFDNSSYDDLVRKLLNHLYSNNYEKIYGTINSELSITYGLMKDDIEIKDYESEVLQWWNNSEKYIDYESNKN